MHTRRESVSLVGTKQEAADARVAFRFFSCSWVNNGCKLYGLRGRLGTSWKREKGNLRERSPVSSVEHHRIKSKNYVILQLEFYIAENFNKASRFLRIWSFKSVLVLSLRYIHIHISYKFWYQSIPTFFAIRLL